MWISYRMWSVDAIKAVKSFRSLAYQSIVKLAPRRNDSNVPPYSSHHELEEFSFPGTNLEIEFPVFLDRIECQHSEDIDLCSDRLADVPLFQGNNSSV